MRSARARRKEGGTRRIRGDCRHRVFALFSALKGAFVESRFLKRFRYRGDVPSRYVCPQRQLFHRKEAQLAWRCDALTLEDRRDGLALTWIGIGTTLEEFGDRAVKYPGWDA